MNADSKQIRDILEEQLADLDESLGATVDDVQMLADLQNGIGRLLADDVDAAPQIRHVLQERYEGGDLRQETYQLVKSMLDRHAGDGVPTLPESVAVSTIESPAGAAPTDGDVAEKPFSSTTVLPTEAFEPSTADESVQVGSVLRDRFLLQKKVAGGNMGVVYKALDRRLAEAGADSQFVAIKVLSPRLARSGPALRALQQEAAKGRCLTHPNIVRFIDLDRDDELYFIVMEWLEGRTLAEILDSAEGRAIDLEQSLDIVRQVGQALEFAHRCGIVHADVKPGNIMVAPTGEVKLFDFGVARVRQTQQRDGPANDVLRALTPAYSSMQVLTGEEPVPADDVFSLGCLMYRLVAGYRVFGPRNAAEAAEAGMTPQPLEALSKRQWDALKKAISFSRVTRFESIAQFLDALGEDAADSAPVIVAEPEDRFAADEPRRSPVVFIALLIALGAIGAVGYQLGWIEQARVWLEERGFGSPQTVIDEPVDEIPVPAPVDGPDQTDAEGSAAITEEIDTAAPPLALPTPVSNESVESQQPAKPIVDFSTLPAADASVPLVESANRPDPIVVRLREDSRPLTVDLMRSDSLEMPLRLRIEEVAYSGNRSPWASGQFSISDDSVIEIPPGQDRARVTLTMASDPLREADQVSTLRIRPIDSTRTQFAAIDVVLEDDDQRAFEARLPQNTIAFAVSQVAVREKDPAVQIDVLRFNPDDTPLIVGYAVRGITATDGEDYFAPDGYSLSFGPRQRSARLLIPLVQDAVVEGDEAFTVELATRDDSVPNDVFQRIVVMIRDDDASGF